jgi:hypothetical protein
MARHKNIGPLNRRRFLIGAGGAALGLPLLESIGAGPLLAQTSTGPRAFLSFHCSSGVDNDRFWPAVGNLDAAAFAGKGMEALGDYASRILIPRGVHGYPVGTWTGHSEGTGQALTAAPVMNDFAMGRSIDQILAQLLSGRESFVLKPGGRDGGVAAFNSISYTGPGQQAAAEPDPARAYRSLMGLNAAPPPDASAEGAAQLALRRQSVIDLVRAEFQDLSRIDLSQADRQKLDAHFSLIRDVEVDLEGSGPIACALDGESLTALEALDPARVEANENFPVSARLSVKIAALALACGYSRSVVLQWGAAVAGSPMYQWDGISHQYQHHPLSHGTTGCFSGDNVAGFKDMLYEIDRWNMAEFRGLLDLLDGYAEADGATLLDNVAVLYSNEFSNGQGHTTGDLPLAIVGGGGYFRLGESLVVDGSAADIAGMERGNSNRLLATILTAFGAPQDGFSDGPAEEFSELRA